MKVPTTGPITFDDLRNSFRGANPVALDGYLAGGSKVPAGATGMYGALPAAGAQSLLRYRGAGLATLGEASAPQSVANPSGAGITGFSMDLFGNLMMRAGKYTMMSFDGGLNFTIVSINANTLVHSSGRLQNSNNNWVYTYFASGNIYTERSADQGSTWTTSTVEISYSTTSTFFLGPNPDDYTTQTNTTDYTLLSASSDLSPGPIWYLYTTVAKAYHALANYGGLAYSITTTTDLLRSTNSTTWTKKNQNTHIYYSFTAATGTLWSETMRYQYAYTPLVAGHIRLNGNILQYSYDDVTWTTTTLRAPALGVAYPCAGKIFYDVFAQKFFHVLSGVYNWTGIAWVLSTTGITIHSSDDGQTWTSVLTSTNPLLIYISHVAMRGSTIVAWKSANNAYVVSTDNGATWKLSLTSTTALAPYSRPLLTDTCLIVVGGAATMSRILV